MNKSYIRILTAVAVAGFGTLANATPSLFITDGINAPLIVPGVGNSVNFSGGYNGWTITSIGGIETGTATQPAFDLDTLEVSGGVVGTLKIFLSDINFGPTTGSAVLSVGGNIAAGGSAQVGLAASPLNILFQNPTGPGHANVVDWMSVSGSPFSVSGSGPLNLPAPYSLTEMYWLTARSSGVLFSLDGSVRVPDGGSTLMLLGGVLAGLGGLGLLRRKLAA